VCDASKKKNAKIKMRRRAAIYYMARGRGYRKQMIECVTYLDTFGGHQPHEHHAAAHTRKLKLT